MPPITMGAFFQKFVVAIFEKRKLYFGADLCVSELSAAANPTKKHGRVFGKTKGYFQTAEHVFCQCFAKHSLFALPCCDITVTTVQAGAWQADAWPKVSANRGTCFLSMLCESYPPKGYFQTSEGIFILTTTNVTITKTEQRHLCSVFVIFGHQISFISYISEASRREPR